MFPAKHPSYVRIVMNLVDYGQTGMNKLLALTQGRLHTATDSSSRRHAFLNEINISNGQQKSP